MLTGAILAGCAGKKDNQKAILDSILKVHDKVMGADEPLMKNKAQLDALTKQAGSPVKDTAAMLSKQLGTAETAMDNWMHNFDPEHKGKSADETVDYMNKQKMEIMAIDTQMDKAISASNQYLLKHKK